MDRKLTKKMFFNILKEMNDQLSDDDIEKLFELYFKKSLGFSFIMKMAGMISYDLDRLIFWIGDAYGIECVRDQGRMEMFYKNEIVTHPDIANICEFSGNNDVDTMIQFIIEKCDESKALYMSEHYEKAKENMLIMVENGDNKMLDDLIHIKVEDLALVVGVMLIKDEKSSTVLNIGKNFYDVPEKDVFEAALINSEKILPPVVKDAREVIVDIIEKRFGKRVPYSKENPDMKIHILTTDIRQYGPSVLFYPGMMEKLHERFGDYFIVPLSMQDLFIVPISGIVTMESKNLLKEGLKSTNEDSNDGGFLTNSIYVFDGKEFKRV